MDDTICINQYPAALTMIRPQHDSGGITEHRGFTEATNRYTTSYPELSCCLSRSTLPYSFPSGDAMLLLRLRYVTTVAKITCTSNSVFLLFLLFYNLIFLSN